MMKSLCKNKLFDKFIYDECSKKEVHELLDWIETTENEVDVHNLMEKHWNKINLSENNQAADYDKIKNEINKKINKPKK